MEEEDEVDSVVGVQEVVLVEVAEIVEDMEEDVIGADQVGDEDLVTETVVGSEEEDHPGVEVEDLAVGLKAQEVALVEIIGVDQGLLLIEEDPSTELRVNQVETETAAAAVDIEDRKW